MIVPRTGFEPAHLTALLPENSASTSFATWASVMKTGKKPVNRGANIRVFDKAKSFSGYFCGVCDS